jgi:hypothetical protein
MAERLDTRQRKTLAVDNDLAAALAATGPDRRAFVIVWLYHASPRPPEAAQTLAGLTRRRGAFFSKILNADREEDGEQEGEVR